MRRITRHGGRGQAQRIAEDLVSLGAEPVNPRLFDRSWPTSMRRRWSELTRVAMDRGPRKRPWEGPLPGDFAGIFLGVDRANGPSWTALIAAELRQDIERGVRIFAHRDVFGFRGLPETMERFRRDVETAADIS